MHSSASWALAAATLVFVGLAGCGTAATSSDGTASSAGATSASRSASVDAQAVGGTATVAPGHRTPEDAADGLLQAELSGRFRLACAYFLPSQQASCRKLDLPLPKGHVSVVGAIKSGDLALVEITGRICTSAGTDCQASTDPSLGLPKGSETFKQAFDKAFYGSGFSPVPCQRVRGKWYVDSVVP